MNRIFKSMGIEEINEGIASITRSSPFSIVISVAGTSATWLFGAWDLPLQILLSLVVLDYITGFMRGWKSGKANSSIGFNGLMKKCGILIVVMLAVLLDRLLETNASVLRTTVSFFFISNEGLSILENVTAMGVPFPIEIVNKLEQLKSGGKKEMKEKGDEE